MPEMTDIIYASGAIDDFRGPVTSFVAMTPAGQSWIYEFGLDCTYVIEDEHVAFTIDCIERDGLKVKAVS